MLFFVPLSFHRSATGRRDFEQKSHWVFHLELEKHLPALLQKLRITLTIAHPMRFRGSRH